MSGFSAHWLGLREPADRRARSPQLLAEVGDWACKARASASLPVIDLGAGSGASLRAIAPHLPAPQVWTLIDQDQELLDLAVASPFPGVSETMRRESDLQVRLRATDLSRDNALEGALQDSGDGPCLITASALLDLVSEVWCRRLISLSARPANAIYAALTYDGSMSLSPSHPFDPNIRNLFNRHQRRDKGFGPALGPEATDCFACAARACGARVHTARSDWHLGPGQGELMRALLEGWCDAALEVAAEDAPDQAAEIERWAEQRVREANAGNLRLHIGHRDLFATW